MSKPLPEVRSLARALLEGEHPGPGAKAQVEAAERVLQRLSVGMSPLVGTGGIVLLLQRSLRRTTADHSWLVGVQIDSEAPWRLASVADAAKERPEAVIDAMQALVAEMIGLVARFLGADMAIRLVRQNFPEVARSQVMISGEEENQ